jgi:hypothetical protein
MTTYIYDSANLSVKDRLTISNLLGLFQSRLNATWAPASQSQNKQTHLVLIDVDQKEGLERWENPNQPKARLAVTADDRSQHQPFISRPIRAFGANGVIVLFNSIAQSLSNPAQGNGIERHPEPARIRMMGRLESPAPPVRTMRPPTPMVSKPEPPRVPPSPPQIGKSAPQPPVRPRVSVRWGPPEPVILPPLKQMPGARIHWFEGAGLKNATQSHSPAPIIANEPRAPFVPPEPEARPNKFFDVLGTDALPPLVNMPVAHKPTEIHTPPAPLIGRVNFEAHPPAQRVQPAAEVPVLRPAPPQWRRPEPEIVKALIDFRSLQDLTISSANAETVREVVEDAPEKTLDTPADAPSADAVEMASEEELQAEFAKIEEGLQSLSNALADPVDLEELPEGDAEVDWWGTPHLESDNTNDFAAEGSLLINVLKAVKASGQPSILEIAGLPVVCVIPARNCYFTTAPAARLESAITARSEVAWRTCASEAEARESSGTEQSRQASLEQLFWTASLLSPHEDLESIADRSVRLRRWPPITESRGRSKFIRYATMISGAQATPRELAEITGDDLKEILSFVNACSMMNLLETSGPAKTLLAVAPTRTAGAGILRSMIEQLTPPKI